MNTRTTLSLLMLAAFAATTASAQSMGDPYAYYSGGLSVGESQAPMDSRRIAETILGGRAAISSISDEERDTTYKVFGGYQFNRYIGLELSYFNLGKFSFDANTVPAGRVGGKIKIQGAALDVVGTWPLTERFSLLGRVGAQYAKTDDKFNATGAAIIDPTSSSVHRNQIKAGLGMQYEVNPSLFVRTEVERYRVSDGVGERGRVNALTVSLVMPFGRASQSAPHMAAAPAYVPPPPEPMAQAAAPVPTPPPPVRRVSYTAESLFSFDQSAVKPEGKAALDQFATEANGTTFNTITVQGHTDRLGSTAYNQTLSEERANAVKTYLVDVGRVDPAKITATGLGETEPATKPDDCSPKLKRAALIACLQPDRRVDIDVAGQR